MAFVAAFADIEEPVVGVARGPDHRLDHDLGAAIARGTRERVEKERLLSGVWYRSWKSQRRQQSQSSNLGEVAVVDFCSRRLS